MKIYGASMRLSVNKSQDLCIGQETVSHWLFIECLMGNRDRNTWYHVEWIFLIPNNVK